MSLRFSRAVQGCRIIFLLFARLALVQNFRVQPDSPPPLTYKLHLLHKCSTSMHVIVIAVSSFYFTCIKYTARCSIPMPRCVIPAVLIADRALVWHCLPDIVVLYAN
jgi:hypothetical protein